MKTDEFCDKYGFKSPGLLLGSFVEEIKEAYILIKNELDDQYDNAQIIKGLRDEKKELEDSFYDLKKFYGRLKNKITDIESSDVNGLRVTVVEVLEKRVNAVISNSGRRLYFEDEDPQLIDLMHENSLCRRDNEDLRRDNENLRSDEKKLKSSLSRAKRRYHQADSDLKKIQEHCDYYITIEDYEKGGVREGMLPYSVKYGDAKIAEISFRRGRYMIARTSLTRQFSGVLFVDEYDFSKTKRNALDISTDTKIKMGSLRFSMQKREEGDFY